MTQQTTAAHLLESIEGANETARRSLVRLVVALEDLRLELFHPDADPPEARSKKHLARVQKALRRAREHVRLTEGYLPELRRALVSTGSDPQPEVRR